MIINNIFICPIMTFIIFRVCPNMSAILLLNFSAFFCGFSRFFVVCRVLCKGGGFRSLWAYFMPVSVRVARDIIREREEKRKKRAAVVVVRLGFCFGVFDLERIINNKGVALYGLRLAGLWLPRLVFIFRFRLLKRA